MDFKSRFQGKTSLLTKNGLTSLLSAPGIPIVKSHSSFKAPQSYRQTFSNSGQYLKTEEIRKPMSSLGSTRSTINIFNTTAYKQFEAKITLLEAKTMNEGNRNMSKSLLGNKQRKTKANEGISHRGEVEMEKRRVETAGGGTDYERYRMRRNRSIDSALKWKDASLFSYGREGREKIEMIKELGATERVLGNEKENKINCEDRVVTSPETLDHIYNPQILKRIIPNQERTASHEEKTRHKHRSSASGYYPVRASLTNITQELEKANNVMMTQEDNKPIFAYKRDRKDYGIGSRERYFRGHSRARSDIGGVSPVENCKKSNNEEIFMEKKIMETEDLEGEKTPGSGRNRSNDVLRASDGIRVKSVIRFRRAGTSERMRFPSSSGLDQVKRVSFKETLTERNGMFGRILLVDEEEKDRIFQ